MGCRRAPGSRGRRDRQRRAQRADEVAEGLVDARGVGGGFQVHDEPADDRQDDGGHVGGAAALCGLLVVAVWVNAAWFSSSEAHGGRAAQAFVLFIVPLLTGILRLIPG
jgi:hypothetical protein